MCATFMVEKFRYYDQAYVFVGVCHGGSRFKRADTHAGTAAVGSDAAGKCPGRARCKIREPPRLFATSPTAAAAPAYPPVR